jgi:hypothetical protein
LWSVALFCGLSSIVLISEPNDVTQAFVDHLEQRIGSSTMGRSIVDPAYHKLTLSLFAWLNQLSGTDTKSAVSGDSSTPSSLNASKDFLSGPDKFKYIVRIGSFHNCPIQPANVQKTFTILWHQKKKLKAWNNM